jgi:hypothetical protein
MLADGCPPAKKFFSDFFYFYLCRVPDKKHSAKTPLPARILPCALCRVWHSAKALLSVFRPLPSARDTRQGVCLP